MSNKFALLLLAALSCVFGQGCFGFSSYQSARILAPDEKTTTVSFSRNDWGERSDDPVGWFVFDVQGRRGTTSKWLDVGANVSVLFAGERALAVTAGVDGRGAVVPDYLAVTLPMTLIVGSDALETIQIQPGAIGTVPLNDTFEFTGAFRFYPVSELASFSYNVGVGIHPKDKAWRLRPEIGWLHLDDHGESETFLQFGIAVESWFGGEGEEKEKKRTGIFAD